MDPRLGFESVGAYMVDNAAAQQQPLLSSRSGGGGLASIANQMMFPSPGGSSFQPHLSNSLGGYFDRDLGRQEFSSSVAGILPFDAAAASVYSAPVPQHSLSSGQGYYTVESLEGKTAGDVFGSQTSPFYGGERNLEIGQQGFESGALPTALQNGVGNTVMASMPPFGVAASLPYLSSHLSQDLGLGGGRSLVHVDGGVPSYLHHAQAGLLPGRMAYEHLTPFTSLGPAFASGPQEWEWQRRNDLVLAALKQKRDLDREALLDRMDREAHMDRMDREAHMDREARKAFLRERSLERHDRLPFVRRHEVLSTSFKHTAKGVNQTWCSVCQLECDTTFNFKTHLGGKRHKLKLNEEASNKADKFVEKDENVGIESASATITPESRKAELDDAEKIQPAKGEGEEKVKVTRDRVINASDGKEAPGIQGGEVSNLGKRSFAEDMVRYPNKKSKQNNLERATGNQFMLKKGNGGKIRRCELCDVNCFSKGDLQAHFKGKRHASQVQLNKSHQGAGVETAKADEVHSNPNQSKEVG
ncbi:hypothetical protein O6H91_Y116300 [Diphasiastrum complanatum]|nr:hypothetical protein O6H91_Y116300 [Diphasiastrum complanatum]